MLAGLLEIPDHWQAFAEHYLAAPDEAADHDGAEAKRHWRSREQIRRERARALAAWNQQLIDHLEATDAAGLLDRLVTHPGLVGAERTYLEAELAHRRGRHEKAGELIEQCLDELPGHEGFRETSVRFAAG